VLVQTQLCSDESYLSLLTGMNLEQAAGCHFLFLIVNPVNDLTPALGT